MTDPTEIAMLRRDIADLQRANDDLKDEIKAMKALDDNRVRKGLVVVGGVAVSLILYIWQMTLGGRT